MLLLVAVAAVAAAAAATTAENMLSGFKTSLVHHTVELLPIHMIADRPASAREGLERSRNHPVGCLLGHSVGQGEAAGDNIYGSMSKIFCPLPATQGGYVCDKEKVTL